MLYSLGSSLNISNKPLIMGSLASLNGKEKPRSIKGKLKMLVILSFSQYNRYA